MTDARPQGAARDYLATPPDAPSDARDWLKAQLSQGVPEFPDPLRIWLDALDWRCRVVVVLLYAEHMTQAQVAWLLGVSRYTILRDLQDVYVLIRGLCI
jgi:DNA-directed RNA polymerase specialized sigma24 family protein